MVRRATARSKMPICDAQLWLLVSVTLVAIVTFFIYRPLPDGIKEPWKARQAIAVIDAIAKISWLSDKLGLMDHFTMSRLLVDSLSKIPPKDYTGLQVEDTLFDGVKVRTYIPEGKEGNGAALIFYHGGGFLIGSVDSHDAITTELAQRLQIVVVSVDYRLCPENSFPVPFEDAHKATAYFLRHAHQFDVNNTRVAISGDSAGGTLAAAVALRLRDSPDLPSPRLQVLAYPMLQGVNLYTPSYIQNSGVVLGSRLETATVLLLYTGQNVRYVDEVTSNNHTTPEIRRTYRQLVDTSLLPEDFLHNYQAPVFGLGNNFLANRMKKYLLDPFCMPLMARDLVGLPETLILTAEYDLLRDDGALYAQRLEKAGVKVTWQNYKSSYHGMLSFFQQPLKTEEGSLMMDEFVKYVQARL